MLYVTSIESSAVLSPSGSATGSTRSTGKQSSDTRFAADRNWAEKLRRTPIEIEPGSSLMGSKNWTPPPLPVAKTVPTVPPFPFQYMGKLVLDDGATTVYLTKGDEIYTVRTGEVIAGSYRVDTLGADYLEVTYLPLDKKQNVAFSSILPPARTDGIAMGSRGVAPVTLAQVTAPQAEDGASASRSAATSTSSAPAQSGGLAVAPVADATGLPATGSVPVAGARGGGQSTTATTTGSGGGMVIAPPTISQMPMSPPTISQMPILPPPSGSMPMFAPTPGATMPGVTASGTLSTSPAPSR